MRSLILTKKKNHFWGHGSPHDDPAKNSSTTITVDLPEMPCPISVKVTKVCRPAVAMKQSQVPMCVHTSNAVMALECKYIEVLGSKSSTVHWAFIVFPSADTTTCHESEAVVTYFAGVAANWITIARRCEWFCHLAELFFFGFGTIQPLY